MSKDIDYVDVSVLRSCCEKCSAVGSLRPIGYGRNNNLGHKRQYQCVSCGNFTWQNTKPTG